MVFRYFLFFALATICIFAERNETQNDAHFVEVNYGQESISGPGTLHALARGGGRGKARGGGRGKARGGGRGKARGGKRGGPRGGGGYPVEEAPDEDDFDEDC